MLYSGDQRNIEVQVSNLHPQTDQSYVPVIFLSPSSNYVDSASNKSKIISYHFLLFQPSSVLSP